MKRRVRFDTGSFSRCPGSPSLSMNCGLLVQPVSRRCLSTHDRTFWCRKLFVRVLLINIRVANTRWGIGAEGKPVGKFLHKDVDSRCRCKPSKATCRPFPYITPCNALWVTSFANNYWVIGTHHLLTYIIKW